MIFPSLFFLSIEVCLLDARPDQAYRNSCTAVVLVRHLFASLSNTCSVLWSAA